MAVLQEANPTKNMSALGNSGQDDFVAFILTNTTFAILVCYI